MLTTYTQTGTQGSYNYAIKDGDNNWANKPVISVSWYSALRFANWLHNGQPTGLQDASTTEDGAYTFNGDKSLVGGSNPRNSGAIVWLSNEDEWYKAAYYKGGGTNAGYWSYPTQSDTPPNNNTPENDTGNSANCTDGDYAVGPPYYSTDVGACLLSYSSYGTFDQGGNVWEWNESYSGGNICGIGGGSWSNSSFGMVSSNYFSTVSGDTYDTTYGFRVASVPEPSTLSLLGLGAVMLRRKY